MAGGSSVFAGVLVRRTIAAEGNPTLLTGAKMNPVGTDLHAVCTFECIWMLHGADCIYVGTSAFDIHGDIASR